jgi:hypothetical protein
VDDLEEQLPRAGVENKDGAVYKRKSENIKYCAEILTDRLRRQIALERLVDCDTVYIRVIDEPWVTHK